MIFIDFRICWLTPPGTPQPLGLSEVPQLGGPQVLLSDALYFPGANATILPWDPAGFVAELSPQHQEDLWDREDVTHGRVAMNLGGLGAVGIGWNFGHVFVGFCWILLEVSNQFGASWEFFGTWYSTRNASDV